MSNFFIARPIFASVLAILITLAGAIALTQLPIARYPQITPPSIVVSARFPGADATTVEQSVAAPIEQQVNGAPNMLYMSSKSGNDGSYTLSITFEVGTNQDLAAVEVQNRVAIAQRSLPEEVTRQGVTVIKRQPSPLLFVSVRATDPRYDYLFLSNYSSLNIYDALARIPGVGQVTVFGARDYGMRIWLDPEKMARLGVTTQDIARVLQEQNVVAPAGTIGAEPAPPGQQKQYAVSVRGRLSSPPEYENVVVRVGDDGSLVKLADIARVELAATDYTRSSRLNGEPVANIGIYQSADANALDVAKGVRKTMEELSNSFPEGITYSVPFDTTFFVSESLREVIKTLFEAGVLVLLVVFLFLESWRATLIPMLTVPIALIGAFTAFIAFGFTINTLTLFALVLAIGLVVDDAIVVVEAVTEKMDTHGLAPREATQAAMKDVSGPVIAIALVLTSVFVPVAFLPGLTGELYRQFALTLSVSVLISALIALTFTPALCAILLRPTAQSHWRGPLGLFFGAFNRVFKRFTERYTESVRHGIRRTAIGVVVFIAVGLATVWMVAQRPGGFVPEEDQGYLLTAVTLPAGASLQRTEAVLDQLRRITAQMPEIESTIGISGFSLLSGVASPATATVFIVLKPWNERALNAQQVIKQLGDETAKLQEANFVLINPASIPGIGSAGGFEFVLEARGSTDMQKLIDAMRDVVARAQNQPELARVFTQFNPDTPQIEYVIDRERAKTLGIPLSDIFGSLQTYFGGSYINDFNLYGRTFRHCAGRSGVTRDAGSSESAVRALGEWRDGAAVDAGDDSYQGDAGLHRALQRVPCDHDSRFGCARLQQQRGGGGDGEDRCRSAGGSRLRVGRRDLSGEEVGGSGALHLRCCDAVRVPGAGRAVRELVGAVRGDPGDSVRDLRRLRGAGNARHEQRCLCADRSGHADRPRGKERDPDRRVRQDRARARTLADRCRGRGRAPASAADPDDLVRVHPRCGADDDCDRCRRGGAAGAGHGRRLGHVRGDGHRHLSRAGVLRDGRRCSGALGSAS